jgi:hypothetical protein
MTRTVIVLLLFAWSAGSQQHAVFSTAQWLGEGIYSAARGPDRLLFYVSKERCPNSAPDQIIQSTKGESYTLAWNETGRLCLVGFVERSDFESDATSVVPWIENNEGCEVNLDSEDRVFAKSITRGRIAVTVLTPIRLGRATATIDVSILSGEGGSTNTVVPVQNDVSVLALARDLTETSLRVRARGPGFVIEIPPRLQNSKLRALVKIEHASSTFVFPLVVPESGTGK